MKIEIEEAIKNNKKYSVFRDNKFIKENGSILVFKGARKKSIGFNYASNPKTEAFNELCTIFNIQNRLSFKNAFDEVVSGDGKELNNLLTIYSSSLCSLLVFYNVVNKPLPLVIDDVEYVFNEVHFEIKNKVYEHPSNMDVVLIANDPDNPAILFLESKFSEYLDYSKFKISEKYFREEAFKQLNDNLLNRLKTSASEANDVYAYGIKQFFAHYIGLTHFVNDERYLWHKEESSKRSVYDFFIKYKPKVFLQEVIFDLDRDKSGKYKKDLLELIKSIQTYMPDYKISVLKPITYQEIFKADNTAAIIDESVRKFYKLL